MLSSDWLADVYQARHRQSGEMVALKHVVYMQEGVKPAHLIRETQALSALKNSGKVVKLRETYEQVQSCNTCNCLWFRCTCLVLSIAPVD